MTKHLFVALFLFSMGTSTSMAAVITLSNGTPAYAQNFDSLIATGTSSTTPAGWSFLENGLSGLYSAGTGSSLTGDTYSFGTGTDRAFGELTTGTFGSTIGAQFRNGGSTTIQSLTVGYFGEQWRLGSTGRTDRLDFQYSLDATSLTSGTWMNLDSLDFLSPVTSGATGAKNGDLTANRTQVTGVVTGLSVALNQDLWIRWTGFNADGNDDGLAIDDFTINATFAAAPAAVPEPGTFALLLTGLPAILVRRTRTLLL